jgi:hypothetical protein
MYVTIKIVSSIPSHSKVYLPPLQFGAQCKVYSIQLYVITFVCDYLQVNDFLPALKQ